MRISDWSSDVCSSDLGVACRGTGGAPLRSRRGSGAARGAGGGGTRDRVGLEIGTDRKSGVEGKRVSGRVGLGGRRIIKKKKHRDYTRLTNSNTKTKVHTSDTSVAYDKSLERYR